MKMPYWSGQASRKPFIAWSTGHSLDWYQAYNSIKHDQPENLKEATLDKVVGAFCVSATILAAQFYIYDFGPRDDLLSVGGIDDGHENRYRMHLGRVKIPEYPIGQPVRLPIGRRLPGQYDPFDRFDYNLVRPVPSAARVGKSRGTTSTPGPGRATVPRSLYAGRHVPGMGNSNEPRLFLTRSPSHLAKLVETAMEDRKRES